ncbi:MAG: hypothetical protein EHM90_01350, partial [Chloroflexi bacterium]
MTTAETTPEPTAAQQISAEPVSAPPSSGWLVVARKEFADQLLSLRFIVLFVILGLAAALPLFIAAEQIRSLAED